MIFGGRFDISGRVYEATDYVTVTRSGSILTLDFLNNIVVPIKIVHAAGGGYYLNCCSRILFKEAVSEDESILLQFHGKYFSALDVDFILATLPDKVPMSQVGVVWDYNGPVKFYQRGDICASSIGWYKKLGVSLPVGCAYAGGRCVATKGYGITVGNERLIVEFENGFKLPILKMPGGYQIGGSMIYMKPGILRGVFVRVHEQKPGYVLLRVIFICDDWIEVVDNIEYSTKGLRVRGSFIKSSQITKQLIL